MRFSAVGERAGLQARVPGLDEMGFSPGGNAEQFMRRVLEIKPQKSICLNQ